MLPSLLLTAPTVSEPEAGYQVAIGVICTSRGGAGNGRRREDILEEFALLLGRCVGCRKVKKALQPKESGVVKECRNSALVAGDLEAKVVVFDLLSLASSHSKPFWLDAEGRPWSSQTTHATHIVFDTNDGTRGTRQWLKRIFCCNVDQSMKGGIGEKEKACRRIALRKSHHRRLPWNQIRWVRDHTLPTKIASITPAVAG